MGKHGCGSVDVVRAHLSWVVLASSQVDLGCTASFINIIMSRYDVALSDIGVKQMAVGHVSYPTANVEASQDNAMYGAEKVIIIQNQHYSAWHLTCADGSGSARPHMPITHCMRRALKTRFS